MSVLDHIAHAALSSRETIQATFDIARCAIERKIPGDFVECGVFGGAQCAAMAKAIDLHSSERAYRRVHLFDSFEGIPAAGPHDAGWTHAPGTSACSLESVNANMKQWGIDESLLVYYPGWFENTLWGATGVRVNKDGLTGTHEGNLKKIAILRLDCDLYESTRVCLEYLYPLVSPGGWVIVDDFALPGCRKAVTDYMDKLKEGFPPVYWQKR